MDLMRWEVREKQTTTPLGQKWDFFIVACPLLGQCQFINPQNYLPGITFPDLSTWNWKRAEIQPSIVN